MPTHLTRLRRRMTMAQAASALASRGRRARPAITPRRCLLPFARMKARAVVMTPHEGEFKRLFRDAAAADASKLDRARTAAALERCDHRSKGPGYCHRGTRWPGRESTPTRRRRWRRPARATCLRALSADLLAQRMPAFEAACAAVWLHGECANVFGPGLDRGRLAGGVAEGSGATASPYRTPRH